MSDEALRRRCASRAVEARERYSMGAVTALWEQLFEDEPCV
jgi:hypothetical protein